MSSHFRPAAAADGPGKGEAKEGLQEFLELCGLPQKRVVKDPLELPFAFSVSGKNENTFPVIGFF